MSKRHLTDDGSSGLLQQLIDEQSRMTDALEKQRKATDARSDAVDRSLAAQDDISEADKWLKSSKNGIKKAENAIIRLYQQLAKLTHITVSNFEEIRAVSGFVKSQQFKGADVKFHPSVSERERKILRPQADEIDVDILD